MIESINGKLFETTVLCPKGRTGYFPGGFGKRLQPQDGQFVFDDWLDSNLPEVLAALHTWGTLAIEQAIIKDHNLLRWKRLRVEPNLPCLPWHSDGADGRKLIMLAQSHGDTLREPDTFVASADIIFLALKIMTQMKLAAYQESVRDTLIRLFGPDKSPTVSAFEKAFQEFNVPCPYTRHAIREIMAEVAKHYQDWIYRHHWHADSVLLMDTQYFLQQGTYCRVVHGRMVEEGQLLRGTPLWRAVI
ncbi:MAG: hypothetical protein HY817_02470 [Candidatus Abawacabacteria bacterium]|nr:hypothetical protein [Candidatus Abawacabacteria bacterium]